MHNLNQNYLDNQSNPSQLQGQTVKNPELQQYAPPPVQHQFSHPIDKISPPIKNVVRTNYQGDNLVKTKSMANVYANPEMDKVNINPLPTTNRNIRGGRGRIPKSQSDNNLILLHNNLSKNNIQQ